MKSGESTGYERRLSRLRIMPGAKRFGSTIGRVDL